MKISPVVINNHNNIKKNGLICAATTAVIGNITCNKSTADPDDNRIKTIHRELPFYTDLLGVFHKKKMDIKIDNANHTRIIRETNIDGSTLTRISKSDDKHRPMERICQKTDKNGVIEFKSVHHFKYIDGKTHKIVKNKDFRNNSETFLEIIGNNLQKLVKKTEKQTEILEKSQISGVLNSTIIDQNGNKIIESLGKKNKDGTIYVEKNFKSIDGTQTKYSFLSKGDNSKLKYNIISNNGEILLNINREFKRISSNRAYSSLNGHGYSIETDENGLKIIDIVKNETRNIKYTDIICNSKDINKETIDFIKTIPADILLTLQDEGIKISMIENPSDGSKFNNGEIKTAKNIYTLSHELGHGIDYSKENNNLEKINKNILFRKNYEDEKSSFLNNLSDIEQDFISYFLMDMGGIRGIDAGASESVAEVNALTTSIPNELYEIRSHYYQKYFPKSIASASKLMMREKINLS